jgi:hypothetical protein
LKTIYNPAPEDAFIGGAHMDDFESQIKELEFKIAEVKKRFPYHSIQPYLIQELEELEDQLDELMEKRLHMSNS